MSHTQHTPGPWVVCIEDDGDAAFTIFAASQLQDGRIASDQWDDNIAHAGLNHKNAEANARLIATAPAMLAVLKHYVMAFEKFAITNTDSSDMDRAGFLYESAQLAIKQATGDGE